MKRFWGTIWVLVLMGGAFAFLTTERTPREIVDELNGIRNQAITDQQNGQVSQTPDQVMPGRALLSVPFFAQAPTADWADPRQQDGCEEASIMMAHLWLTGKAMTVKEAEAEIIAMSEWQKDKYGEFVDRSMTDTSVMFKEYYGHEDFEVRRNVTVDDIKKELSDGHLVIVPTNGQILDNPNYTGDGPITHMMPIIGYDDAEGVFITNDPGTRNGRQFKFTYQNLMDSIYDYQTGKHVGYEKTETIMMVIRKTN